MSFECRTEELSYWIDVYRKDGWRIVSCFPNPLPGYTTIICVLEKLEAKP